MWRLALVVLAGCAQVFGLDPPKPLPIDAVADDTAIADTAPDASGLQSCRDGIDGLVACFDFEGAVTDSSPSQLTVNADKVTYAAGELGMGAVFDTNSSAHIAETPLLDVSNVTIEMWVKLSSLPTMGTRMGLLDNDAQYGMFVLANGVIECLAANAAAIQGPSLVANQWTHVACTVDGTRQILYVNGQPVAIAASMPLDTTGVNGTSIGGNSPSGDPLSGELDLLRVYSVARTQAEICADAGCM